MDGYFAHQLSQRRPFWVAVRLRRDGFRQGGEGAQLPPPGGELGPRAAPDRHLPPPLLRAPHSSSETRRCPCSDGPRAAVAQRSSGAWAVLGRWRSRARAVPAPRSRSLLGRSPCPRCPSVAFGRAGASPQRQSSVSVWPARASGPAQSRRKPVERHPARSCQRDCGPRH